jgi:hypothetical protein
MPDIRVLAPLLIEREHHSPAGPCFQKGMVADLSEGASESESESVLFPCGRQKRYETTLATIGVRKVAKPTIISALNLFRACTLNEIPLCNT